MEEKNKTIKLTPKVGEKTKEQPKEQPKKLSYEELENAAREIAAQADMLARENSKLRSVLNSNNLSEFYADLDFRFKVLKYSEYFDPEIIETVVNSISDIIMSVKNKEEKKEEERENGEEG